ncbi:MAG: SDR family oxidoreductase [Pseudomonadales bacterium]|jgi:NAD(P)-dependent dehydrogenase (short-subunit alcohol dehydrogenase family)|nr:short-chain dehydrogenase [Gammaproteobacteria bacterium]MDP6027455.1 SDR family oxidoreductase [Pseudomonadales bacterium]MDP6315366.1 SDR family oxidoreductase [Pseudomonadales bacterium]MDP7315421.1 SDR family oxidoreductase [Pseudomonadales bacterium]MDP7576637.1 SDR family oxidoreductase [Pseudomonadales bacterium]|tara:strand:- start:1272 stop:2066 length:795 start_codon:yes stop_codon:yes gene_type:complete
MTDRFGYKLEGKVAIVTGGGALDDGIGNGRAAALLMEMAGASVVVVDRDIERAESTVAMMDSGRGIALAGDITEADTCRKIVEDTLKRFGRLDILDNNVGVGSRGNVVDEDPERWQRVMQINVSTMFLMSKYAIPAIKDSGGGSIVNVSSISAIRPRGLTAYSASKGAVISLSKAMAVDHATDGIRVNCVLPGPVFTPLVYGRGMSDTAREIRRQSSLLQIEGTGWDVGNAVLYLVSDMARYVTGQSLVVDGGVTLKGPDRDTQ